MSHQELPALHDPPPRETLDRVAHARQTLAGQRPQWQTAAMALAGSLWPADRESARVTAETAARQLRNRMLAQNTADDRQCRGCSPKEMQRRRSYPKVPALSTLIVFLESQRALIYKARGQRANGRLE